MFHFLTSRLYAFNISQVWIYTGIDVCIVLTSIIIGVFVMQPDFCWRFSEHAAFYVHLMIWTLGLCATQKKQIYMYSLILFCKITCRHGHNFIGKVYLIF